MGAFRRGHTHYIRFRYGGKDVWRGGFTSKRQAELALGKIKAEIAEGKFLDPLKGNKISYGELLDRYLKEYSAVHKKPSTHHRDTHRVRPLRECFGSLLLKHVTADRVQAYIEGRLKAGRKAATVNREIALLKHSFTMARTWGLIRQSPVTEVKKLRERNERMRYLTAEEYGRLLGQIPDYLKPVVITAVNTGMRLGELLALRWDQVNWPQRVIVLTDTKNGQPRGVPLNSAMVDLLRGLMRERARRPPISPYVFVNPLSGDRWRSIRDSFNAAVTRAGLEDFRFHDLRHTCASWLAMSGADLLTVASVLGHKTLAMTQRYSHLSPAHKLKAVEALGGLSVATDRPSDAGKL